MSILQKRLHPSALLAAAVAAGALAAAGPTAAKTLRIGAQADAGTMDPHAQNIQTTISVLSMMYEALVTRDKSLAKAPQLAAGWEILGPNEWRFTLRPDVEFHDGAAFGADDVAMSIARAQSDTSQFKGYVANIAETRIVDDLTIDIVTKEPDPLLLDKLTQVFIMDKGWADANNVQRPQDPLGEGRRRTPSSTPTARDPTCSRSGSRTRAPSSPAMPPTGERSMGTSTRSCSSRCVE